MSSQFAIAFPAEDAPRDLQPILVPVDPGAIVFDQASQALLVADGYSGALVRVEHHHGAVAQRRIATIDAGGVIATNRIGGMTVTPDGTLYVSRVGYGQSGAVFRVAPGGVPQA